MINKMGKLVRKYSPNLSFTILEVGARPVENIKEPFYELLEIFPKSKVVAFEFDETLCKEMNDKTEDNVEFYSTGLGLEDGEQTLYETVNPMCSSLYKPNVDLLSKYSGLDVVMPKSESIVKVKSLDNFSLEHDISNIDFIKIDIQGAELDVFKGGHKVLQNTVFIISEVEFIPVYLDQPLFGDVCQELLTSGLQFHKFLNLAGRALKPMVLKGDPNTASQHMWSDAVFMTELSKINSLSSDSLLKLAVLSFMYGSPDVTYYCFQLFDQREKTDIHLGFANLVS